MSSTRDVSQCSKSSFCLIASCTGSIEECTLLESLEAKDDPIRRRVREVIGRKTLLAECRSDERGLDEKAEKVGDVGSDGERKNLGDDPGPMVPRWTEMDLRLVDRVGDSCSCTDSIGTVLSGSARGQTSARKAAWGMRLKMVMARPAAEETRVTETSPLL